MWLQVSQVCVYDSFKTNLRLEKKKKTDEHQGATKKVEQSEDGQS